MQVFLPFKNLESITLLDSKRLGNQIYNEGYCLIQGKWKNHPASKIWINHKKALSEYCLYGLEELSRRGKDYPKWIDFYVEIAEKEEDTGLPPIIGNERFHQGHRSQLLLKNYEWYSQYGWKEKPGEYEYTWSI